MREITYDPKSKTLNISLRKTKIVDSDIQENCVIDYDEKGEITNIEVLDINASELLKTGKV